MILIFVSFENIKHAEKVADYLVDKHLAACVVFTPVISYYWWRGKKVINQEIEAIVKTKKENFGKIRKAVETLVGYEIPQLIAIEVVNANKDYLEWLEKEAASA